MITRQRLAIAVITLVILVFQEAANAGGSAQRPRSQDERVCNPLADYFLGMEDYPEAIARHKLIIKTQPDNALAHYHLGFAYGFMGQHDEELAEYSKAVNLGLDDWELFLNLGLLYLETENPKAGMEVLKLASLLAPARPETHFNLGLAYQKLGLLEQAEQEVLLAVEIDPRQADARNTLATIYAEEGKYSRAHEEWSELVKADPSYAPARENLTILEKVERGALKLPRRINAPTQAP